MQTSTVLLLGRQAVVEGVVDPAIIAPVLADAAAAVASDDIAERLAAGEQLRLDDDRRVGALDEDGNFAPQAGVGRAGLQAHGGFAVLFHEGDFAEIEVLAIEHLHPTAADRPVELVSVSYTHLRAHETD